MPTRKNSLPKIFLSQYVSTNLLYRERAIGFLRVLCVSAVNVCLGPGWLPGEPPEYLMESTELARNGWENLVLRLGLRTGPLRLGACDEVIDFTPVAIRTGQVAGGRIDSSLDYSFRRRERPGVAIFLIAGGIHHEFRPDRQGRSRALQSQLAVIVESHPPHAPPLP